VDDVTAALRLLCRQLVSGTLVDQQFDERQPLRFVDRFGEQFSIARVIESRILLIHSPVPHLHSPNGLFRNACGRAIRFSFAPRAIHRSMVDDGTRELPAKPAHTAVCHRRDPGRDKGWEERRRSLSSATGILTLDLAATVHQFPPAAEPAEG